MKKFLIIAIPIVVVLLLLLVGPALLDLYRLERYVTQASAAAEADGGPWPRLTDVCTGCHGDRGNTQNSLYPSLAGQPAPYLAGQLRSFAHGQRVNPNMGPLSMTFDESEIKRLSDYFSRQALEEHPSFKPDPTLRDRGKQLVTAGGCAACHGERLMGHDQFPRLAGQGYEYLLAQFEEYAVAKRSESTGTMKNLSVAASPEDRSAMASYLASLATH
jgi:cytochrome c553